MNQEKHWNKIADKYEGEIFDVFNSDRKKLLAKYFAKHSNQHGNAIDFGCGIGKAFRFLAPSFAHVIAVDISDECLSIARANPYKNITFKQADLAKEKTGLPLADFVFCCNVIMLPEVERNAIMFRNIQKALKRGGTSLVVVPSLESIFFSSWRLIQWYRKEGTSAGKIPESELSYFKASKRDIVQGVIHIDDVPTKHYSSPELRVMFAEAGLTITALEKLEYEWSTEFDSPPKWMKDPYPWDWLVECVKE